jgi:hypothetical protein
MSMISFKEELGGITFVFDSCGVNEMFSAFSAVKAGKCVEFKAMQQDGVESNLFKFILYEDDCFIKRKKGWDFHITPEVCEYALYKLTELNRLSGFSTPELAQFSSMKGKKTLDTFFAFKEI